MLNRQNMSSSKHILYHVSYICSQSRNSMCQSQLSSHLHLNYLLWKDTVVISSDWDPSQERFTSRNWKFLGENDGCFVVVPLNPVNVWSVWTIFFFFFFSPMYLTVAMYPKDNERSYVKEMQVLHSDRHR